MSHTPAVRVLVVDDTKLGRLSVIKTLSWLGIQDCAEAEDGESALAILESREIHLILLDMLMPGLSGLETLIRIRKAGYGMPVIMVTADIQDSTLENCRKAGADGFITKPIKENKLRPLLREHGFL